jgi:KRAB domain-containing zinc finger protein
LCGKHVIQKKIDLILENAKNKTELLEDLKPFNNEKCSKSIMCEQTFSQLKKSKKHNKLHDKQKHASFQCNKCKETFPNQSDLSTHMRRHSSKRRFHCQKCNASFTVRASLVSHMRRHDGIKPYECKECGKRFTDKSSHVSHLKVHIKCFECDICNRKFILNSNLVRHKIFHKKGHTFGRTKKTFDCQICKRSFSQKITLERHYLTHSGIREFKCAHCDKHFSLIGNLRKHTIIHLKEKRSINKDTINKSLVAKKEPLNNVSLNLEKDSGVYIKLETDA